MPRAVLVAAFLLGGVGLQLLGPQLLRRFIDQATGALPGEGLTATAVLFIGVALVQQLVGVGLAYFGDDLGWRTTNRLRDDVTLHCLRLGPAFHGTRTPGEMVERIDGDATTLAEFFSRFVAQILGSALRLVGVLALLYAEDWRIGLLYTAYAAFSIGVIYRLRGFAVPAMAAERETTARLYGFAEERLGGLDDVRSRGAGAWVLRGLALAHGELLRRTRAAAARRAVFSFAYFLCAVGLPVSALAIGGYGVSTGLATIGTAYLLFRYAGMLQGPIGTLSEQTDQLQRATAGIARVGELLDIAPPPDTGARTLPPGPLSVELDRVSFAYTPGAPVLTDVSFALPAGRVQGLLGRTGAGKTTIGRLLFRLYDPDAGTVRIGGADARSIARDDLRRRVGLVTQDVHLFRASLRENVTLFDPTVPGERVQAALDHLGLGEWATARGGLDAELDPSALSAGEAQLVALARAFLADPGLIVLDEASSRLDPATERLLERAVDKLLEGRTAVVIAHRLATLDRADDVLILEDGRVREWGERERLSADPRSRYAELLR
ncbi:MAG TPA: ABC transporter ATP-binding protein, partial [Solirubrobacteraceae bacterium]